MVNIIMPVYNAHNTLRQAIGSVIMQDDLDNILLTIVDDCSTEPYDYLLDEFKFMNIEIMRKDTNTGCGQSRQYGIDRCKCKYFMFLDADDCLYHPDSVKKMHQYMENEQLDMLYTDFIEELNDDSFFLHQNSGVWMHGKMFRTSYIQDNDIRYNETRLHEDHAFNFITRICGGKLLYIDYTTYIWRRNGDSLTRSDSHTFDVAMINFIENAKYVIVEYVKRKVSEQCIAETVKKYLLSLYKYYNFAICDKVSDNVMKWYIQQIKSFISMVPHNVRETLTFDYLISSLYSDDTIDSMISENIVIHAGIREYYDIIMNPYHECGITKQNIL